MDAGSCLPSFLGAETGCLVTFISKYFQIGAIKRFRPAELLGNQGMGEVDIRCVATALKSCLTGLRGFQEPLASERGACLSTISMTNF